VILVVAEDLDTAKGPDDDAKNVFRVKAEYCHDRMDETVLYSKAILPMSLDFRALRGPRRDQIVQALDAINNPQNLEPIRSGEMLEHSTVRAALLEKEERFKMPQALLVPPQVCVSLADTDGIKFDIGGEHKKFQATVNTSELVCFVVYSIGPPRHFTYLELKQNLTDGKGFEVAYKDSLKQPSTSGIQAAKQILINLGLEHFVDKVVPSNKVYQPDGWSCGIYVLRWIEAALRRARGEPRIADASITDVTRLTNEFISKVIPKAKAKSKAKSKAKAKSDGGKAAVTKETKEPTFETLEDALTAAHKCTKCVVTKQASKGCRACMGEWFEHIRIKGAPMPFVETLAGIIYKRFKNIHNHLLNSIYYI
jgi:hypothetical protein